jgi:AraC family transcriptional activator of pobA
MKGFKVHQLDTASGPVQAAGRRDVYKICLISGQSILHYPERSISLDGTYLFFGNPYLPYSSEAAPGAQTGYSCVFTEEFLRQDDHFECLQQSPLFKVGSSPVLLLHEEQRVYLTTLFQHMLLAQASAYLYREELVRSYIQLILHESLRLQAPARKRLFPCYCRLPDAAGTLGIRWQTRRKLGR